MPQIWSAATIQRFSLEGEQVIAKELKCLIARTSLDIVQSTPTYNLPSDVISVRRVTWMGKKLIPMPARDYHRLNVVTTESEPIFYVFNQQGRNTLRLHPVPNQTIAAGTDLFGPDISTCVIVEYYQIPDGSASKLPQYIRRRLLKYYVLYKCFSQEGKGQNLKASARAFKRYQFYLANFKKIYTNHFIAELNTIGYGTKRGILAPPRLSYAFGEKGEF